MNERIQKWLENHLVRSEYTEFGWQECHRYEFDEHELEKFAELIVRECFQTLVDNTPERFTNESAEEDWDKGYDQAMKDCVHHIQEHFGVKE